MNLDLDLVHQARSVLGTRTTTETVHHALAEVVRAERVRALLARDFSHVTNEGIEDWSGGV
jgi:Arc/MetJ family transcription regulator